MAIHAPIGNALHLAAHSGIIIGQVSVAALGIADAELKIPALMTKADDEKIFERQALIEEADSLVRGLYESFLSMRLSDEWEREAKNITRWIDDNAQD